MAKELKLPLLQQREANYHFFLVITPDQIELQENNNKKSKPILVDFLSPQLTYRIKYGGGKKQLIAKAVGGKNYTNSSFTILDATAGFGVDAFILASLGYEVMMLERSPIIGLLLADALKKLKKNLKSDKLKLQLQLISASDHLNKIVRQQLKKPDVIYLDPMYPKSNSSALNKKTMRILHKIVGDDSDADQLLPLALASAKKRVVIKRAKSAPTLTSLEPDLKLSAGGSSRYDIYLIKK